MSYNLNNHYWGECNATLCNWKYLANSLLLLNYLIKKAIKLITSFKNRINPTDTKFTNKIKMNRIEESEILIKFTMIKDCTKIKSTKIARFFLVIKCFSPITCMIKIYTTNTLETTEYFQKNL